MGFLLPELTVMLNSSSEFQSVVLGHIRVNKGWSWRYLNTCYCRSSLGDHFSLPVLALIFPACSLVLSRSSIERLSLHCSPNWKIMLCKGKLILETRMDKESSIFFGSPEPALALAKAAAGKSTLGRALQCDALAFLPHSTDTCWLQTLTHTHTYTHICIHLPTPDPSPPSLWTASLTSGSVTSAGNGCRTGWLLAGAGLLPLLQSRVSMVYYVLLLLRCFSCSHTVLPKEHSLGVIFFLLTFLMLCCIFLQFPVFLSCLPPCHICMLCMYGQVDG